MLQATGASSHLARRSTAAAAAAAASARAPATASVRARAADSAAAPIRAGSGINFPTLIRQEQPKYTSDAMRAKIQGDVELEAVVLAERHGRRRPRREVARQDSSASIRKRSPPPRSGSSARAPTRRQARPRRSSRSFSNSDCTERQGSKARGRSLRRGSGSCSSSKTNGPAGIANRAVSFRFELRTSKFEVRSSTQRQYIPPMPPRAAAAPERPSSLQESPRPWLRS